jgi:hypothetical protein
MDGRELYGKKIDCCKGVKWFISIKSNRKYLEVFLWIDHCCVVDEGKWKCGTQYEIQYEIKLLNQLNENNSIIRIGNHTFNSKFGIAFPNFIDFDVLLDKKNGFIKSNKIEIDINLKSN